MAKRMSMDTSGSTTTYSSGGGDNAFQEWINSLGNLVNDPLFSPTAKPTGLFVPPASQPGTAPPPVLPIARGTFYEPRKSKKNKMPLLIPVRRTAKHPWGVKRYRPPRAQTPRQYAHSQRLKGVAQAAWTAARVARLRRPTAQMWKTAARAAGFTGSSYSPYRIG